VQVGAFRKLLQKGVQFQRSLALIRQESPRRAYFARELCVFGDGVQAVATKARQTRIRARLRMIAFQCRAGREQLGSLGSPIRLRKWPIGPRFGLGEWELVYCFSCCSKLYVELPPFAGAAGIHA